MVPSDRTLISFYGLLTLTMPLTKVVWSEFAMQEKEEEIYLTQTKIQ